MSRQLIPYLIFPGTCREALEFYSGCFRGKIAFLQTVAEAPFDVPPGAEDNVFNSEFAAGDLRFRASDNMPGSETLAAGNISMYLSFSDADEQKAAFETLSDGGKILFPLEEGFGMVHDKFGIAWMLSGMG